ncbi:uncharacterized protein METZ01_LOCUS348483, partial [marine metagenome]
MELKFCPDIHVVRAERTQPTFVKPKSKKGKNMGKIVIAAAGILLAGNVQAQCQNNGGGRNMGGFNQRGGQDGMGIFNQRGGMGGFNQRGGQGGMGGFNQRGGQGGMGGFNQRGGQGGMGGFNQRG